jgi:hypothetical protein
MSFLEHSSKIYSMSTYRFGFMHDGSRYGFEFRRRLELELDDYLRNADLHPEGLQ